MRRARFLPCAIVAIALAACVGAGCSASCPDDVDNCGACGATCASTCTAGTCNNECALFGACNLGETCSLALTSASHPGSPAVLWATVCVLRGSIPAGGDCSAAGANCDSGLICIATSSSKFTCVELCNDVYACTVGSCITNANIPNGGGYCGG